MNVIARATHRVLMASHSHPAISNGGAEIAAWRLYEGVAARPDWRAWFVGCTRDDAARLGSPITQPFDGNEFLYSQSSFDWFKFANPDPSFPTALGEMLRDVRPDIVHFHHYVQFGMETFMHVRRLLPDSQIVVTLHEFLAICHHYGQMVTQEKRALCYEASPRACNRCFPAHSRADFFLRKLFIQRFFALVDHFVAPSQFLADRYIQWGIPASKMSVIENVTQRSQPADRTAAAGKPGFLRVGFFGQISFLKGIHVLLEAARILEDEGVLGIHFDIHGDHTNQPPEFQTDFLDRMSRAGKNVRFHGAYDNARVDMLMQEVDVALVPSIWWENSPVVIQECMRNRLPILCSNIGGMAEKVRSGIDGLHFPVGSADGLCGLLRTLVAEPSTLAELSRRMRRPEAPETTVDQHLYQRLMGSVAVGQG
jgi:glycosyltransferase involved in cell wall biosynthesis